MNLDKLKDAARKFEQKEDWRRAIEVYRKAIHEYESGQDPVPDVSIYNRVGDLCLKANDSPSAVQAYERAIDLYTEQGFFNNAIALCGKILRVNPGRIQTYLKLAQLNARKNVVSEAKKYLIEFIERMNSLGQLNEAFTAVKGFADQFPGNQEIRLMLSELLRAAARNKEAREQLEKLMADLEARGDRVGARKTRDRLEAIGADSQDAASAAERKKNDLVFLDTGVEVSAKPGSGRPAASRSGASAPPSMRPTEPTTAPVESPEGLEPVEMETETPSANTGAGEAGAETVPPLDIESITLGDPGLTLESHALSDRMDDFADIESSSLAIDMLEVESTALGAGLPSGAPVDPMTGLQGSLVSDSDAVDLPMDDPVAASLLDLQNAPDSASLEVVSAPDDDFLLDVGTGADTPASVEELNLGESDRGEGIGAIDPTLPTIGELEERILEDPEDPEAHRSLGEALIAAGEYERGADELDLALVSYETREDWEHAMDLVNELIRLDPNAVRYHQKRVELAYRTGDKNRLIDAYLELGDALMRAGSLEKALAVYGRVVEHEPQNQRAAAALEALAPPESQRPQPAPRSSTPRTPAAAEPEGFVDLGALVLEDQRLPDTRMRVEDEEPTGDEQRDFQEMLAQFKRGIEENLEAEDYQAHYDLGIAFKEMGLLDEAIAEFQKALRAPEGRLRTSEALGVCFFEKAQFGIAEAILKRAVENHDGADDEKVGLIYWLGRAAEEQGNGTAALGYYERVLAVDIRFRDIGSRISRVTAGRRQ